MRMLKYLPLLLLVGCLSPQYNVGDCAYHKMTEQKIQILKNGYQRYVFCYLPECATLYTVKQEYLENLIVPTSCPAEIQEELYDK